MFVLRIFVSPLVSVTAISYTDHKQEYMDQSPWRPWGLSLENWPELYKHLKKKKSAGNKDPPVGFVSSIYCSFFHKDANEHSLWLELSKQMNKWK